jgi:hypothetical protein
LAQSGSTGYVETGGKPGFSLSIRPGCGDAAAPSMAGMGDALTGGCMEMAKVRLQVLVIYRFWTYEGNGPA